MGNNAWTKQVLETKEEGLILFGLESCSKKISSRDPGSGVGEAETKVGRGKTERHGIPEDGS